MPGIENVNLSALVGNHEDYVGRMGDILDTLGLAEDEGLEALPGRAGKGGGGSNGAAT